MIAKCLCIVLGYKDMKEDYELEMLKKGTILIDQIAICDPLLISVDDLS